MPHRRPIDILIISIAISAGAALPGDVVRAAVLYVDRGGPGPYRTIQSAINAAIAGTDSVFVHCGIYAENIVMRNGVSVAGAGAHCTVIDGRAAESAVTMIGIASAATTLSGFTIRNGRSDFGGGIYVENGSPTISRNVITGNTAVATGGVGGYGGGILVTSPAGTLPFVTAPNITRNVIVGNRADRFGGGIEIYADDGTTVSNNIIKDNSAGESGGGIDTYQSFPTITNNTIVRNCIQGSVPACSMGGGGIALTNSGVVNIRNNLIAWNQAGQGGGVDLATSTASFRSNNTFQNTPANYAGVSNPTGSNGNIAVEPLLVDEVASFKGFQPRSHSPLVEAANTSFAPAVDIRGIPRPLDSNANGTALADIGARENEGITSLRFTTRTTLTWDPSGSGGSPTYNLYRGDLQTLRATGIYTQNTSTVPGAQRQCALGSPAATDTQVPTAGSARFYVAVVKRAVEGTLGFNSVPTERPYTAGNRCP